ncbi:MAG TPA: hypothetical protein VFW06_11040 [Acidimicrobiia bacterium]|nr:hypothetical protein [Acidimicrobiia bacterium]
MRVLVVGTMPGVMAETAEALGAAGHAVVRCHDGAHAFPCAGLESGGSCPIEDGPVDVVVAARDHPWPRPSPFEEGAVCALRRHIPMVVTGPTTALHPYGPFGAVEVPPDGDLVATCEEVVAAPLEEHSQIALDNARTALELAGVGTTDLRATVRHRLAEHGGGLVVELRLPAALPESPRGLRSNLVAKVVGALRLHDPYAATIDASIVT